MDELVSWVGSQEGLDAAGREGRPVRWTAYVLLGVGVLHGSVLAARIHARGSADAPLAVGAFVALELLLLLPLVPVAGRQVHDLVTSGGRRLLPLLGHAAAALLVVAAYRFAVLSAALLVELGSIPARQLELWWEHAGPWQLQSDLLLYGGLGALLGLWRSRSAREPNGGQAVEVDRGTASRAEPPRGIDGRQLRHDTGPQRLTVRSGGVVHVLPLEEIRWIEGAGSYARIHTGGESHLLRQTLRELSARLEPAGFVRVHRSAILNLRHLRKLQAGSRGRWTARLADGSSVPVAASRTQRLEAALGDTIDG